MKKLEKTKFCPPQVAIMTMPDRRPLCASGGPAELMMRTENYEQGQTYLDTLFD